MVSLKNAKITNVSIRALKIRALWGIRPSEGAIQLARLCRCPFGDHVFPGNGQREPGKMGRILDDGDASGLRTFSGRIPSAVESAGSWLCLRRCFKRRRRESDFPHDRKAGLVGQEDAAAFLQPLWSQARNVQQRYAGP